MLGLHCQCWCHEGIYVRSVVSGCASCAGSLCVCEKRDGWLVAWGLCECMLIRSSIVWLLPSTLLKLRTENKETGRKHANVDAVGG